MKKMTFVEHITELRDRILKCLLFNMLTFGFCYFFSDEILRFLANPLLKHNQNLISTGLTEVFFTYVKVALFSSFLITMPLYLFQLYMFIKPAMLELNRRVIGIMFCCFTFMFILGCVVMYYGILPHAVNFLTKYGKSEVLSIKLYARSSEYLSIVIHLMIGFGVSFQLPVILILFGYLNIISSKDLIKFRRFAIVIIFFFSAIATPPDVLSQVMLGLIILIFYELTIFTVKLLEYKRKKDITIK